MPKKVALLSVLKPVDDIRLFEKIGHSFKQAGYEIHSLGFESKTSQTIPDAVFFYPLFNFKRLSIKRVLAGWRVFSLLQKIKPDVVVCGSVELLFFGVLYKISCSKKITLIYDIQENYYLNTLYTETYPKILRLPLAYFVRVSEKFSAIFVDYFFLAEKCYEQELNFLKNKHLILENKMLSKEIPPKSSQKHTSLQFCLSGTIGRAYGSEQGIRFFEEVQKREKNSHLHLIGRCVEEKTKERILTHKNFFLKITLSSKPLAHQLILEAQNEAAIILMPYKVQKAYQNRIPSKFYEAMALGKCIMVQKNPAW